MPFNFDALRETEQSETLFVNDLSKTKESNGELIYKFGFGQSPFFPPEPVIKIAREEAHRKEYIAVQGLPKLREKIAAFHSHYDKVSITADRVVVGPGSKILIYAVMAAFKEAEVLLITPSWVSYEPQAKLAGHCVIRVQTTFKNRWRITPQQLNDACENRKDKTIPLLMVLNYPGNPDGLTYSELELKALSDVAREHSILIISDEIYGLLNHNGEHVSLARFYPEGTIITTGLSKWCGAGGWRLGVALLPESLNGKFKDCYIGIASETYSCATTSIEFAAIKAYEISEETDNYLAHQRRILATIGNYAYQTLSKANIKVYPPEGGFYLNPDFSNFKDKFREKGIINSQKLCERLLDETGVILLPGGAFGYLEDSLIARLAYVDFDGAKALRASEEIGLGTNLPLSFIKEYCPKINEGTEKLVAWVQS